MCFVQSQSKGNHRGGAAEGRPPLWWRPKAATFVLALNRAHVRALNTAHVLRLNKADVLALNKAHVLRLNTKICPVFAANTKETTKGGRPKAAPPLGRRPKAASFALALNTGHILVLRRKTRDMCCVASWDMCFVQSQHKGACPGPGPVQRARHTCMGLEVQRGSRSLAWV